MAERTKAAAMAVARAARWGTVDEIVEARRVLAATKIEEAVEQALAKAPPLTDEQVDRIALALRGGR